MLTGIAIFIGSAIVSGAGLIGLLWLLRAPPRCIFKARCAAGQTTLILLAGINCVRESMMITPYLYALLNRF